MGFMSNLGVEREVVDEVDGRVTMDGPRSCTATFNMSSTLTFTLSTDRMAGVATDLIKGFK